MRCESFFEGTRLLFRAPFLFLGCGCFVFIERILTGESDRVRLTILRFQGGGSEIIQQSDSWISDFGMSFGLLAPNGDLVSVGILKSEKVPIRGVLFADRHQPSAPEIGGV